MPPRTLVLSSFEKYLAGVADSNAAEEHFTRQALLQRFPHPVMLELSYPELDNAERWCWQHIGPMNGDCRQSGSQYRVCFEDGDHTHTGKWTLYWYEKTDYDFGYCEFYFAQQSAQAAFLEHVPKLDWGERWAE